VKQFWILDFGFWIEESKRRSFFCLTLSALLCALCSTAGGQESGRVYRVGFLFAGNPPAVASRIKAFREKLVELGYAEGKNLAIETRYGEGRGDRMPALATELVHLKVDVILTAGPTDTRAAKNATNTLPIIMAQDSDPIASGFVASLARPGGNITGLSTLSPQISGKQLELLKEIVPKLSRVAVLRNPTEPGNAETLREMQLAGEAIAVRLQYLDVREPVDIANAFAKIANDRANAVIVLRNPVASTHRKRIIDLTAKQRLPAMHVSPDWVEGGGLMSYSLDVLDNYRRAATYVDRILKGTRPADLPVEQPKKFEFVINLKTAKQIGLTIPQSVLYRADKVIK
jgi:ABC-type uncharacterized transport system substrate-binding protein